MKDRKIIYVVLLILFLFVGFFIGYQIKDSDEMYSETVVQLDNGTYKTNDPALVLTIESSYFILYEGNEIIDEGKVVYNENNTFTLNEYYLYAIDRNHLILFDKKHFIPFEKLSTAIVKYE